MNETLQLYTTNHVVYDRIHDLHEAAAELRAGRRDTDGRPGAVARLRLSLGRRLISFGSSLSDQRA